MPKPGSPRESGILHLHGRIGDLALGLAESDLTLTSADFGDAYLRDSWASPYVDDRMRVRSLVLVGYAAENVALRLLLETMDAARERCHDSTRSTESRLWETCVSQRRYGGWRLS